MQTPVGQAALRSVAGACRAWRETAPTIAGLLNDAWAAARAACPDVVVFHPKALAGLHIAERLGIPSFAALGIPALTPTDFFPSPLLPLRGWGLSHLGNRASHLAVLHLMEFPYRRILDRWRVEALGLKTGRALADGLTVRETPVPRLYGFSRHLQPPPPNWGSGSLVAGYWFTEPAPKDTWTPEAERLTRVVLNALQRTGLRGVLATGWGGLARPDPVPEHVYVVGAVPHAWLFPRVLAVVHHGCAGTTHEGLRWGRPTAVCPVFGDQPYWGQRVFALGAGPKPLPLRTLTTDRLAHALRTCLAPVTVSKARQLGALIRAERGVDTAIARISAAIS
jgi:sterol 3beta-glucosyltransferase